MSRSGDRRRPQGLLLRPPRGVSAVRDPLDVRAGLARSRTRPQPRELPGRNERPGRGREPLTVDPPKPRQGTEPASPRYGRADRIRGFPRSGSRSGQAPQESQSEPPRPADDRHALGGSGQDRCVVRGR